MKYDSIWPDVWYFYLHEWLAPISVAFRRAILGKSYFGQMYGIFTYYMNG